MRIRHSAALLGAVLLSAACGGSGSSNASLDTDDQKASYGIGLDMGRSLAPAKGRLDMAAFTRGVEDAMAGTDPALEQDVIQTALQAFSQSIMEAQQAEQAASGEKNKAEGEAYLAQNGAKEGVVTTESGLQYEVLREGDGPRPTADDQVRINYKGTLIDGTQFDSSYDRGEPAVFSVGGVITGFSEALQLMPVGSQFRFVIPGDLGYGAQGTGGDIGPNATLIF
ncbi:MAG TPA: FKBP-type peptidyl-prolyl cis-trans isomerase, partial [Longimicrobiales bacterium]|nr:FKBP-type peptidyl-prolyl cis-trans isomerase [Longimicrobiales bacterium]